MNEEYIIDDGNLYDRIEIAFAGMSFNNKYQFIYMKKQFYVEFYKWLDETYNCRIDWSCRFIFKTKEDMLWFKLKNE